MSDFLERKRLRTGRSWIPKLAAGRYALVDLRHAAQVRYAVGLSLVAFFERLNALRHAGDPGGSAGPEKRCDGG